MSLESLRTAVTAVMLFVSIVLAGYVGRTRRLGVAILVLLSLVWLTVDRGWEGATLVTFGDGHGVVAADLVAFAGLVAAAWLTVRRPN